MVLIFIVLLVAVVDTREALSAGRWVVCFKTELMRGPYATNQVCYRCALADSGGYNYVNPGSPGNVCGSTRNSNWRTFPTRTAAVWWMDKYCGCRSSAQIPEPEE